MNSISTLMITICIVLNISHSTEQKQIVQLPNIEISDNLVATLINEKENIEQSKESNPVLFTNKVNLFNQHIFPLIENQFYCVQEYLQKLDSEQYIMDPAVSEETHEKYKKFYDCVKKIRDIASTIL